MIPKIIHYTWFSGEEMPPIVKECIASWKRFMPDFEYRLWDRDAIKDLDCVFLKEALAVNKWAYAADYVRLYALYHEGGIYLDTDVMVFKAFDNLLHHQVFLGKEDAIHELIVENTRVQLLTAHCTGAEPHSAFIKDCLDYYNDRHFILSANLQLPQTLRYNLQMLPYIEAVIAREYGYNWAPRNQTIQHCKDGLTIYPSAYFCGNKSQTATYCEHFTLGSWRKGNIMPDGNSPSNFKKRLRRFADNLLLRLSYILVKID